MSEIPITPEPPKSSNRRMWIMYGIFLSICLLGSAVALCFVFSVAEVGVAQSRAVTRAAQTQKALSVNASGTFVSAVSAATATHVAAETERAKFEIFDQFNNNTNGWGIGTYDDNYGTGQISILNGVYVWNVDKAKQGFVHWESRHSGRLDFTDFDVYVDARLIRGSSSGVCYGLQFRVSLVRQVNNYYIYIVCDNGYFYVSYYDGESNSWSDLIGWTKTDVVNAGNWNTIGISARGTHFVFTINDWHVAARDDNRLDEGEVRLATDVQSGDGGTIWFDNFALQSK